MTDCDNKRPCTAHRNNNEGVCGRALLGALSRKQRGEFNMTKRHISKIAVIAALMLTTAFFAFAGTTAFAEGTRDIIRSSKEVAEAVGKTAGSTIQESSQIRWNFHTDNTGSISGVSMKQKVKFYAYSGEYIFLGISNYDQPKADITITMPDGSVKEINITETRTDGNKESAGFISTLTQETAGPNGVMLPDEDGSYKEVVSGGYEPYYFKATQDGVYVAELHGGTSTAEGWNDGSDTLAVNGEELKTNKKAHVTAWDITVAEAIYDDGADKTTAEPKEYHAKSGRVWMDAMAAQVSNASMGMYGNLYAVTRDGYTWKFSLNGIMPHTFGLYANSRGSIGMGTNASAYHSIHQPLANDTSFDHYKNLTDKYDNPDGIYILGPDNNVTDIDAPYHMFLNKPDKNVSESIVASNPKPIGRITKLTYDGIATGVLTSPGDKAGFAGVGGYFEVETEGVSSYRVVIDMSNMYAKHYHGETVDGVPYGSVEDASHNDEICLSTDSDPNFIYYNKENNQWYAITAKGDRHPTTRGDITTNNYVKDVPLEGWVGDPSDPTIAEKLKEYKSLGRVMLGNAAVDGTNRIHWNGRDQYGRILPVGTYFGNTGKGTVYAEPKAGEIHFPMGDAEVMQYGVSIWLEDVPGWMEMPEGLDKKIEARSKLYYNNREQSLLRDFTTNKMSHSDNGKTTGNGNNIWYWNLPMDISNDASGQKKDNSYADMRNSKWFTTAKPAGDFETTFEDYSIDGIASYKKKTDGNTVADRLPTNSASVFKSNGADHGIADVWSYVPAPAGYKVELKENLVMGSVDTNEVLLTGFVFLDTPEVVGVKNGTEYGVYDKLTNDRELPNATVVAEYGDEKVERTTNSNGYYSIPINTTKLGSDRKVKITVTYNEKEAEGDAVTYKLTTIGKNDGSTLNAVPEGKSDPDAQKLGMVGSNYAPNVSVQTVTLSADNAAQKEFHAANVGFTKQQAANKLRIQAEWNPEELMDVSMNANFDIYGVPQSKLTGEIKTIYDKLKSGYGKDSSVEEDYEEDVEKLKAFFSDSKNYAYKKTDVSVDLQLGATNPIDELPNTTYKVSENASEVEEGEEIVYYVFYTGNAPLSSLSLEHKDVPIGGSEAYDNFKFTITTEPSELELLVWYDKNHNGAFDEGEDKISGAEIHIAKRKPTDMTVETAEVIAESINNQSELENWVGKHYQDEFSKVVKDDSPGSDGWKAAEETIKFDDPDSAFTTNDDGLLVDHTSTAVDKLTYLEGLIPGHYVVTIDLPKDSPYNTAAFTGDGEKDNSGGIVATYFKDSNTIVQFIDIGTNAMGDRGRQKSRAAYSYMAGLSVRKSVEAYNTTQNGIDKYAAQQVFVYKIMLSSVTGDTLMPVEDTMTDLDTGIEKPGDYPDKTLHFKNKDAEGKYWAVFTLKAGERITINDIANETEYKIVELDNTDPLWDDLTVDEEHIQGYDQITTRNKNMPTGFTLSTALGNSKERPKGGNGVITGTASTSLVIYTNKYEPVAVSAYGGEKHTPTDGEPTAAAGNHNDINIGAVVKLDGRTIDTKKDKEKFKLVLEPSTWFTVVDIGRNEYTLQSGTSPALNEGNSSITVDTEDAKNSAGSGEVTVNFDEKYSMTFTQPGVYTYILREMKPYSTDDLGEPLPGVKYASETYKLYIEVTDDADLASGDEGGTGHLVVSRYFWRPNINTVEGATTAGKDNTPTFEFDAGWSDVLGGIDSANKPPKDADGKSMLVFNNKYEYTDPEVEFSGTKTLNGRPLNAGEFTFNIEPAGKKDLGDRSFDETSAATASMPTPHWKEGVSPDGDGKVDGLEVNQAKNTGETANNITFNPITFTAEQAGPDEPSAIIYKYKVTEEKGTLPSVRYDEDPKYVYVRVYKEAVPYTNPDLSGDTGTYQIVHAVQCDKDGNPVSGFEFVNEYTATALTLNLSEKLSINKTLKTRREDGGADRTFKEGDEFKFVLEPESGAPAVSDNGTAVFTATAEDTSKTEKTGITFDDDKVTFDRANDGDEYYEYTLREMNPYSDTGVTPIPGISYDSTRYKVRVYVKDDFSTGQLALNEEKSASGTGVDILAPSETAPDGYEVINKAGSEAKPIEFTNVYDPNLINVPFSATKEFNRPFEDFFGADKSEEGFKFTLTPVEVIDLEESKAEDYKAGTKEGDEYSDKANMPMPEVGKDNDGEKTITSAQNLIDFSTIPFESVDAGKGKETAKVYHYTLKEEKGDNAGIVYDDKTKDIYFSVYMLADASMGDGTQVVSVDLNDAASMEAISSIGGGETIGTDTDYKFVNKYNTKEAHYDFGTLAGKIKKEIATSEHIDVPTLEGGEFFVRVEPFNSSNGSVPPGFSSEDGYITYKVKSDGTFEKATDADVADIENYGDVVEGTRKAEYLTTEDLSEDNLTLAEAGEYEYLIREVTPTEDGIDGRSGYIYDNYQYKLKLAVEDNLSGSMICTPSISWRDSLGTAWSDTFSNLTEGEGDATYDAHAPKDYAGASLTENDIKFINQYTVKHKLTYNSNVAVENTELLPDPMEYEENEEVKIISDEFEDDKKLTRREGEIFVGWSTVQHLDALTSEQKPETVFTGGENGDFVSGYEYDDAAGDNQNWTRTWKETTYKMPDSDVTLYAVWAVDANNNGCPDYDGYGYYVEYNVGNTANPADVQELDADGETWKDWTDEWADADNFVMYYCRHNHVADVNAEFIPYDTDGKLTLGDKTLRLVRDDGAVFVGWSYQEWYKDFNTITQIPTADVINSNTITIPYSRMKDLPKAEGDMAKIATYKLPVYAVYTGDVRGTKDPDTNDEKGDNVPDYYQVAYEGNAPEGVPDGVEVKDVPVDGSKYDQDASVTLASAPTLEGYTFVGWAEQKNESDPTKIYPAGHQWTKTNKLDVFYAQWTKNEQTLILQVYDDANYSGIYDGASAYETMLEVNNGGGIDVTLTQYDDEGYTEGETEIEDPIQYSGGGIAFASEKLTADKYYKVTVTVNASSGYETFRGFRHIHNGIPETEKHSEITSEIIDGNLVITETFKLSADNFNSTIRYGISKPHTVSYNFNGAPASVHFAEGSANDREREYAYFEGATYPEGYDGKVKIEGKESDISGFTADHTYIDGAGETHIFIGWSSDPQTTVDTFDTAEEGKVKISYEAIAAAAEPEGYVLEMVPYDLTLYAIWDEPFSNVTLMFDPNGGTADDGSEWTYSEYLGAGSNVELTEDKYQPGKTAGGIPALKRGNAVFVGWSLSQAADPVTQYSTADGLLVKQLDMNSSYTLYAVWAEDLRGKLTDADGKTVSDEGHGYLQKQNPDGIPDYLQVFYDLNVPSGLIAIGNTPLDTVTYNTDGTYTLTADIMNSFDAADRDALMDKTPQIMEAFKIDSDNDGEADKDIGGHYAIKEDGSVEITNDDAEKLGGYIRSSDISLENYMFEGWSLNDSNGNTPIDDFTGKETRWLIPSNTLNAPWWFTKSAGSADTLYAIWTRVYPAVLNVHPWHDINRDGVHDANEPDIAGFTIVVKKAVMQPDGAWYTEDVTGEWADPKSDNGAGNITVTNLLENYYELTLTLDDETSKYVTGAAKGAYIEDLGTLGMFGDDVEVLDVSYNGKSIKIRYKAVDSAVGNMYIRFTEGYQVVYDANTGSHPAADGEEMTVPEDVDLNGEQNHYYRGDRVEIKFMEGLHTDDLGEYYVDTDGERHYFLGWSTNPYSPEPEYKQDGALAFAMKNSDVTLYAIWRGQPFGVTYDFNGGDEFEVPEEYQGDIYEEGTLAVLWYPTDDERPIREDEKLVFVGWSTNKIEEPLSEDLTSVPQDIITSLTMPHGGVTVYAVWAVDGNGNGIPDYAENAYIVKYHANGGFPSADNGIFFADYTRVYLTGQGTQLMTVEEGKTRVSREDAVLIGWTVGENSTGENPIILREELDEIDMATEVEFEDDNITVYAVWAADLNHTGIADYDDLFGVIYDANGGNEFEAPFDRAYKYGDTASELWMPWGEDVPTHEPTEDYDVVFAGWSAEPTGIFDGMTKPELVTSVYFDDYTDKTVYAVWASDRNGNGKPDFADQWYRVDFKWLDSKKAPNVDPPEYLYVLEGTTFTPSRPLSTSDYTFGSWYVDETGTTLYTDGVITENTTLYGTWNRSGLGGGGGGGCGNTPVQTPDKDDESHHSGGDANNGAPDLNRDDHYAYVVGYEDGLVKPEEPITRAEVSAIFFRILSEESRNEYWSTENSFSDTEKDDWYYNVVSTMANANIIHGYPDGTFLANNKITRAEFATIAARFDSGEYSGKDKFSDISGHWASEYINRAAQKGWIAGYGDGTFRPDQYITRAEVMSLVNRVLGRKPNVHHMLDEEMVIWLDNADPSAWYYADIQEATNSHSFSPDAGYGYESWTAMRETPDWVAIEQSYLSKSE